MAEPWIIDQENQKIRRKDEEKRPQIHIEAPPPLSAPPPSKKEKEDGGTVIVIDI